MENEKRLIDKEPIKKFIENGLNNPDKLKAFGHDAIEILAEIEFAPTVDAYTAEQVASIIQQADKAEARNQELEKECAWLKSCLNCKIRKECPRHCGKVVHDCDHWEYGDSVVHGECGARMDGEN